MSVGGEVEGLGKVGFGPVELYVDGLEPVFCGSEFGGNAGLFGFEEFEGDGVVGVKELLALVLVGALYTSMRAITLRLNGAPVILSPEDPETPLLYILRNDFALKGTRFGCGTGLCGACTVLVNGTPMQSCDLPIAAVAESEVDTIESLTARPSFEPLRSAFLKLQAGQCGYCLSGILVSAYALLLDSPNPDRVEIREALAGHICRCGVHDRIIRAVEHASATSV